jgi:hypothetical protein
MAELLIQRRTAFRHVVRDYKVLVDGKECASVNYKKRIPIAPGKHNVQVRLGVLSSPSLEIAVEKDATEILECGPDTNPFINDLYYAFF